MSAHELSVLWPAFFKRKRMIADRENAKQAEAQNQGRRRI